MPASHTYGNQLTRSWNLVPKRETSMPHACARLAQLAAMQLLCEALEEARRLPRWTSVGVGYACGQ
jgi:hypothetical protein